jgi:hypothetical protein
LSTGKPLTVWFTSAAVGVPANGSAKVISIDDAPEGDFIQVKPAGTRDTMFCSPGELTLTRPARRRVAQPTERAAELVAAVKNTPPQSTPPPPATPAQKAPDRPRSAAGRSAPRAAEITVTLNSTAAGEWTVEVLTGKKRTVRPTPVQPAEVAKAARSLPATVAQAIETSLEAARQRQLERVERLREELDAAQRALQELQ